MFDLEKYSDNVSVITDRGDSLSYSDLNQQVELMHASIPGKGLFFILCENKLGSLVGYVTCINNGIPAVLLDGNKDLELVQNLIGFYRPEYLWMPSSRGNELNGETIYQYQDYSLKQMRYDDNLPCKVISPELSICLTTSGSTGSPKLVRLSKKNLLANAESIGEYLGIDSTERPVTVLPMHYSFGLSVINSHMVKGATILLTDKAVCQKEFWSFIKENKATSISGVPYTFEMLKRLRIFSMDLPDLRYLAQAGGKLNKDVAKEYVEYAREAGKKFYVMYGQTEATARMSYLPWENALDKYASIGVAIPGGQFSLIDADGREITEAGKEGELVYFGENVSLGYAECREDLAKNDENHGALRTGDIAQFDDDEFYYITGRLKRFVKVWGNRCNLDAVEQLCKAITANCACTGVDDLITVFVTEDGLEDIIMAMLVEKTGFSPLAFRVRKIDEIPLMTSGKTDYPALRQNW